MRRHLPDLPGETLRGLGLDRSRPPTARRRASGTRRDQGPGRQARHRTAGLALMRIVPMNDEHADAVLAIYQAGIDEGNATFETVAPDWPTFDGGKLPDHRFV